MRPKTHIQHTHKQIKYNDLYRYETNDTHNIHTNKLNTMTFIDMRPKTRPTHTINKLNTMNFIDMRSKQQITYTHTN